MPSLFYAGQPDYIEKLNTLATAASMTNGTVAASFLSLAVTGQASFAAGSAAAPSVKVGAEQNGLYSSAANTLDVALGGIRGFQFGYNASGVNYFRVANAVTGAGPLLLASGSDTNVPIRYRTQAAGSHIFETGSSGNIGFVVSHTASAVNYLEATGAITAGIPAFIARGSDTNVSMLHLTKGTGAHFFSTGGGLQLLVSNVASAVNYVNIFGAATGGSVALLAQGSDTNISNYYGTKGTGTHQFFANGGLQMLIGAPASSVNYWQFFGAAAAGALNMYADGADTNIAVVQNTKGTGSHFFRTNGGAQTQLVIAHVASTVNWPVISGSATGNAVTISTNGTDANRSISLTAAGTGLVQITNDSLRIVTSKTPASATATGTQGQIAWDASYIYVCTATDTWKRAALSTW